MCQTLTKTKKYWVSCEQGDIDITKLYGFISNSYWAKGIPIDVFEKGLKHSLCFSLLSINEQNEQIFVGFGRMITDKATFAYLADVYIDDDYRGLGLGKQLVSDILAHEDLQGLRRIMLATSDAHGLYQQFGFEKIINIDIFMQVWNSAVYTN